MAIGGTVIARDGERVEGYDEAPVNAHMKTRDIVIEVCFDYNHELPRVIDNNGHAHVEGANQPLCKGSYNDDTLERKIYQVARETAA